MYMKPYPVYLSLLLYMFVNVQDVMAENFCPTPLTEQQVLAIFSNNAANQIRLEFGDQYLQVNKVVQRAPAEDLVRVEADVQYRRPGVKGPGKMHVVGWVSRCRGTTIVRGNTWLADGTLSVTRYRDDELPGQGILLGNPAAALHVLAYIDSRCPNCHRLISYALELVRKGELYIELRQVAYLESIEDALVDTRLFETSLASQNKTPVTLTDSQYLELVGGLVSDAAVDPTLPGYIKAKSILLQNTHVAREVLHLESVPGVLIKESQQQGRYRVMGHWEMNRLMQPDL